ITLFVFGFFFSSRRRHTRSKRDWSSDVCSSDYWKRVGITWRDCPRLTPAAIADERRAMGDIWVAQEYEGSFVALVGLVYPDFERALVECDSTPEGRAVGGIDFGWRNPFAALWGVLDAGDVLWIDGERYGRQTPLHQHAL